MEGSVVPRGSITGKLVATLGPLAVEAVGSAAGASLAVAIGESIKLSATLHPPSIGSEPPAPGTEPVLPLPESGSADWPDVLLRAQLLSFGDRTSEGQLVVGVFLPWWEIVRQLQRDPAFLYQIPWRKLEELVAGAFERDGWSNVVLTPRSGDNGRDVIATKTGVGSVRIIDQVKAYKPGHAVTAQEVDSVIGALHRDRASKAIVTTTSMFAPGVYKDPRLALEIPHRIELMDGTGLCTWLLALKQRRNH